MSAVQTTLLTIAANRPLLMVRVALLSIGLAAAAFGVETGLVLACSGDDGGSCE